MTELHADDAPQATGDDEPMEKQYLIVVYRVENTADGFVRSVVHAKFGPETWEKALSLLAEANKLKKADPNLIVNLTQVWIEESSNGGY